MKPERRIRLTSCDLLSRVHVPAGGTATRGGGGRGRISGVCPKEDKNACESPFSILLALSTTLNYQQSALNYLQQERRGKTQINEIHR